LRCPGCAEQCSGRRQQTGRALTARPQPRPRLCPQDVLGLRLNRVTLAAEPGPAGAPPGAPLAKRGYDVDEKDFFWEGCGSMPFPKVHRAGGSWGCFCDNEKGEVQGGRGASWGPSSAPPPHPRARPSPPRAGPVPAPAAPSPQVAEEVETQLQKYKSAVDEINAKAAAGGQQVRGARAQAMRKDTWPAHPPRARHSPRPAPNPI
jgi:hypothetical protein